MWSDWNYDILGPLHQIFNLEVHFTEFTWFVGLENNILIKFAYVSFTNILDTEQCANALYNAL